MATYSTPPPPFVETGNFLSAYFVNQLSESLNTTAGFVYGANVARWTYPGSLSISKDEGIWMLQHKYDKLRVNFFFGNQDMTLRVLVSKSDVLNTETQIFSQSFTADGPVYYEVDLTTNPGGFSLEDGEMYFVRVEMEKNDASTDLFYVNAVYELGTGLLTKPTLSDIISSTVITKTYLNSLVSAARDLHVKVQPTNLPFTGVRTATSVNRTNTFLRWEVRHLSRFLHVRFQSAPSGGGADGVILYLNDQKVKGWANNGNYVTEIFDLQALPLAVPEPTWGVDYELKFVVDRDAGAFTAVYLWELPYL